MDEHRAASIRAPGPTMWAAVAAVTLVAIAGCGEDAGGDGDGGSSHTTTGSGSTASGGGGQGGAVSGTGSGAMGAGGAAGGAGGGSGGEADAVLIWTLNGSEVARAYDAEVSTDYLFLPYWGRNVQAYFTGYPSIPTGTYGCGDFSSGPVNVSLITSDNSWSNLDNLPDRWKNLNIVYCDQAGTYPDSIDMWLRLDEVGARLRGVFQATIVGAAERQGETLVIDGVFDVDVPGG